MIQILVLGGTRDAVRLVTALSALEDVRVIYSLAGVTREPIVPTCEVRTGGFGGVEGLQRYLEDARINGVLDATHPFAARMAMHAAQACGAAQISRLKYLRPAWEPEEGDAWTQTVSAEETLPHLAAARRIFLTIGVRELEPFAGLSNAWFLVRFINSPDGTLPLPRHEVLIDRGPFSLDGEMDLMSRYKIDALVTKNSGGQLVTAKLTAARRLGIPVLMIKRPRAPAAPCALHHHRTCLLQLRLQCRIRCTHQLAHTLARRLTSPYALHCRRACLLQLVLTLRLCHSLRPRRHLRRCPLRLAALLL